ncbi:MAG: hypothetical protein M3301_06770 [Chloroflexota bacterium]|nr:hypothetical protein [Chloroflexota bacterium]
MNDGLCTLQYAVGRTERCPGERCPFWEEEVEVGCVVALIERQLPDQPALAQHLLELRASLDRVRNGSEQEQGRRLFYRLRNEEQGAEVAG